MGDLNAGIFGRVTAISWECAFTCGSRGGQIDAVFILPESHQVIGFILHIMKLD